MKPLIKEFDNLLRGNRTDMRSLAGGTEHLKLKPYAFMALLLGIFYGLCMGLFAVLTRDPACFQQLVASAVKVPALFFLTLVVTFPSLYVFSALFGAKLRPLECLRIVVSSNAVNLTVLASFGTILIFFTLTTKSYVFMTLLNVLFFTVAGVMGLGFLLKILYRLEAIHAEAEENPCPAPAEPSPDKGAGPEVKNDSAPQDQADLRPSKEHYQAKRVFQVWLILYALVGAQMGWVLRPFVGFPGLPFTWFRPRESNFFQAVIRGLVALLGG